MLISRKVLISVAIGLAMGLLFTTSAFAWSYLGSFSGSSNWSPNSGEKWAQFADDGGTNRYLDVDARNFYYDSSRIGWMWYYAESTSMVFHAFRRDTNCFVNVTGTGYWWTSYPYPSLEMKTANCSGESYSGNNEVRIWQNSGGLSANTTYYAGAEYKDRQFESGGARLDGEMNFDAYALCYGCKTNMGKFYFNSSNQFQ